MLFLKLTILHVYWFFIVKFGPSDIGNLLIALSLGVATLNYYIFRPAIEVQKYFLLLLFFIFWGTVQDFIIFGLGGYETLAMPTWMLSLWIVFVCYYGDLFDRIKSISLFKQIAMGLVGGLFAYWAGAKYSGIGINPALYYPSVALSWAIFFPLTIKLCYSYSLLDRILDFLVFYSFDKSGFKRRSRYFKNNLRNIEGENILVTGGTSGIGLSCARELMKKGANVYITGRDREKGEQVASEGFHFVQLDLANWDHIVKFCKTSISFDHVVLNAGGMPLKKVTNSQGAETQFASQLVGHYLLASCLKSSGKLVDGARFVWVSSGGMYLKKLDLDELFDNYNYDKVSTYANVKRAQVAFVEDISKQKQWEKFYHISMHPGWVYTKGIADALPKFSAFMHKRLRSAKQGADTIIWLVQCPEGEITPGRFYFDRAQVTPYISKSFIPSVEQREKLKSKIDDYLSNLS